MGKTKVETIGLRKHDNRYNKIGYEMLETKIKKYDKFFCDNVFERPFSTLMKTTICYVLPFILLASISYEFITYIAPSLLTLGIIHYVIVDEGIKVGKIYFSYKLDRLIVKSNEYFRKKFFSSFRSLIKPDSFEQFAFDENVDIDEESFEKYKQYKKIKTNLCGLLFADKDINDYELVVNGNVIRYQDVNKYDFSNFNHLIVSIVKLKNIDISNRAEERCCKITSSQNREKLLLKLDSLKKESSDGIIEITNPKELWETNKGFISYVKKIKRDTKQEVTH